MPRATETAIWAALELQEQGRLLVTKGEVDEGLALLEEAAVIAVSGELGPHATGVVYCNSIDVCRRLADYGRASEWTRRSNEGRVRARYA